MKPAAVILALASLLAPGCTDKGEVDQALVAPLLSDTALVEPFARRMANLGREDRRCLAEWQAAIEGAVAAAGANERTREYVASPLFTYEVLRDLLALRAGSLAATDLLILGRRPVPDEIRRAFPSGGADLEDLVRRTAELWDDLAQVATRTLGEPEAGSEDLHRLDWEDRARRGILVLYGMSEREFDLGLLEDLVQDEDEVDECAKSSIVRGEPDEASISSWHERCLAEARRREAGPGTLTTVESRAFRRVLAANVSRRAADRILRMQDSAGETIEYEQALERFPLLREDTRFQQKWTAAVAHRQLRLEIIQRRLSREKGGDPSDHLREAERILREVADPFESADELPIVGF